MGVMVAGVMLYKNRQNQMRTAKTIAPTLKITPTISVSNADLQPLEVTEPEDQIITAKKSIIIKGKGNKDSLIVIQSPIKQVVFKSDQEDFSYDFPLALGENVIHIAMYPKGQQSSVQERDLKVFQFDE